MYHRSSVVLRQATNTNRTMPTCIKGLCQTPVAKEGRARWFAPLGNKDNSNAEQEQLRVHNSITDDLDAFVPLQNRTVTWYTCGPTVYDACHMGHARAYLTFDILRRILQDYLHYNVVYQLNITDVDDKIILRARQNKLVQQYEQEATERGDLEAVRTFVTTAMQNMRTKLETKLHTVSSAQASDDKNATAKQLEKQQEAISEAQFKLDQFLQTQRALDEQANNNNNNSTISDWIALARDAIAAQLDTERGASITDPAIFEQHARHYETEFHQDMAALGVREPDLVTRVTEFVPQIVDYIQGIVQNGYAYESNGSVYFDTHAFKSGGYDYRKLKPGVDTSAEEMAEGEGALTAGGASEKKHPNDFALWKASKPGEPAWDSLWGPGRPGWHIECSVMASDIFGNNLDIHGGGVDLMFPHHDNEMAQAEAYHQCQQWVNYFLHAGHLHIKGLKMSKSLKNFITIRQALQEHTPRQLRLMFLMQPWNKPMNYSDQTVDDAKAKERYFYNFFGAAKSVLRRDFVAERQGWTAADRALSESLLQAQEKVHQSLLDNFKTYEAIQTLVDLVQECNKYMAAEEEEEKPKNLLVKKVAMYVTKILRVFGTVEGCDDIGFGDSSTGGGGSKEAVVGPFVDAFVQFREKVRVAARSKSSPGELLAHCDDVRDTALASLGVRVEDSTETSVWKMDDPEVIRKEVEEKRRKAAEVAAKKRQSKIDRLEQELAKLKLAAVPPAELFKTGAQADKWGSYDDSGKPTTTKEGEPLSKSQQKATAKELKNHEKSHEKLVKAAGEKGVDAHLAALARDLEQIKLE